jgi:hypothetical protein
LYFTDLVVDVFGITNGLDGLGGSFFTAGWVKGLIAGFTSLCESPDTAGFFTGSAFLGAAATGAGFATGLTAAFGAGLGATFTGAAFLATGLATGFATGFLAGAGLTAFLATGLATGFLAGAGFFAAVFFAGAGFGAGFLFFAGAGFDLGLGAVLVVGFPPDERAGLTGLADFTAFLGAAFFVGIRLPGF